MRRIEVESCKVGMGGLNMRFRKTCIASFLRQMETRYAMKDEEEKSSNADQADGAAHVGVVVRCSPALNGTQRRYLRSIAHHLKPIVMVGDKGLHEGVLKQVERALLDHELIKVKLRGASVEDRRKAAEFFHKNAKAQVAQILGRMLLLYKEHPEKPKIELPRKSKSKKRKRNS